MLRGKQPKDPSSGWIFSHVCAIGAKPIMLRSETPPSYAMDPVVDANRTSRIRMLRRRAASAALPVAVLAFWCGGLLAMRRYPTEYDWRYMPLSNLLSPRRDPAGHLWASAGIAVCGLCGLGWSAALARLWNQGTTRSRPSGIRMLQLGSLCMPLAALPPEWLRRIPEGHQLFTLLAFAGGCLGIVYLMFQTIERIFLARPGGPVRRHRIYATTVAGIAVLPILFAALAQAYVFYVLPELGWVKLSWRAEGVQVFLSFAFWEWITCFVLSAYALFLSLAWLGTFTGSRNISRDQTITANF
jgi:hypothetical protein